MGCDIFGLTAKIRIAKKLNSHWLAMSLIPSESYSFPEHFTTTRAASREPKMVETEAEPEAIEPPPQKPAIVALPNQKPRSAPTPIPAVAKENASPLQRVAPPVPNPALRRSSAPPPRIPAPPMRKIALAPTLKPTVRWNNRAPAMHPGPPVANNGNGNGSEPIVREVPPLPARNVIQMRPPAPPQVLPRPVVPESVDTPPETLWPQNPLQMAPTEAKPSPPAPKARPAQPRPVPQPAAPTPARLAVPQADFFEAFAESNQVVVWKRRRTEKMRRFIVCESIAVGVLLPLAAVGLLFHPENAGLHWILNILTISAAVVSALIPIIFFAATPTLPQIEQ